MDIEKYTTVAISILVAAIVKDVWDSFKKTTAQEVKKIKATSITRRLRLRLIVDAAFAVGLFAGAIGSATLPLSGFVVFSIAFFISAAFRNITRFERPVGSVQAW